MPIWKLDFILLVTREGCQSGGGVGWCEVGCLVDIAVKSNVNGRMRGRGLCAVNSLLITIIEEEVANRQGVNEYFLLFVLLVFFFF